MNIRPLASRLIPILVAASIPALAQGVSGTLNGTVTAVAGGPLAEVKVTIRSAETGLTRVVRTDKNGRFTAPFLAVGAYALVVEKEGFQTVSNLRASLSLGETAPVNVKLAAVAAATVDVTASVGTMDTERTTTATLVSPETLTTLPVAGRRWESFAFLTPQVTSSSRGDLAIAGQRGVNTAVNVDGANFNSSFFGGTLGNEAGGTPFTLSSEAIREFQVITDGASAEFGRMGGGYLNAITKSGTNDAAGSLFYYERPKALIAKDHITGLEVADFSNRQFGFSVGGPIIKDKLFYFFVVDMQRDSRPNTVVFGRSATQPEALDPTKASDIAFLSRGGAYTTKRDQTAFTARFDYNPSQNHSFQLRMNRSSFTGDNGQGTNVAYDSTSLEEGKTLSLTGQWNWIVSDNLVSETKVSYLNEDLPRTRRSEIPQVTVTNLGRFGESLFNRLFETKDTQFLQTLTWYTPEWQVRGGFDLVLHDVFETFAPRSGGVYTFNSVADYRAGLWNRYEQFFSLQPGVSVEQAGTMDEKEREMAAFVQADWKPTSALKLGFGLRWDRQEHPDFGIADFTSNPLAFTRPGPLTGKIPTDTTISPRFSFTYTPESDGGRTVIRGSAGRFVSRTPSVFTYQVLTSNGQRAALYRFSGAPTPAMAAAYPQFVRGAAFNYANPYQLPEFNAVAFGSGTAPDIQTFSPKFKNPRTTRASLQVERTFEGGFTLSANVTASKTTNLERITDLNLNPAVLTDGRWVYPTTRPNANYRTMQVYLSDGEGTYRALVLSAQYEPKDSVVSGRLSYTYAQEKDNDSNERSFSGYTTQDPNRLQDDFSWSANDRRHVVTGYVNFFEKWYSGVNFGFNLRYLGGAPYNPTFTSDLNRDGNNNDRPLGMERNSFREPGRTIVDLKLSRTWKVTGKVRLQASADVFNLFNKTTRFVRTSNFVLSGTTVTPTLANWTLSSERNAQLGLRLSF